MRIANLTFVLTVLLASAAVSEAQSLGSVAKKERERRDKNKKEGVASREFTQEEVSEKEEAEVNEAEEADAPTTEETETKASGQKPSPFPGRVDVDLDGKASDPADAENDRKKSEAQWRARVSSARTRIAAARENVQALEGLFLPQGGYYVDTQGRVVIESLEHLQSLVREAKNELAAAEKALKDLQEEARQAGVPPGWLR